MKQTIYDDPFDFDDWDTENSSRCFIHISNSLSWRAITGAEPPTTPLSSKEYARRGLPWFEHYADGKALGAMDKLKGMLSIGQMAQEKGVRTQQAASRKTARAAARARVAWATPPS